MAELRLSLVLFCLSLNVIPIKAPFPKCSPFVFINKFAESDSMQWLTEGMPGHVVPVNFYTSLTLLPNQSNLYSVELV